MKHTQETRSKLSEMRKGKSNPFFGKKHSPETIAKIKARCKQNCKGRLDLAPKKIKIPCGYDLGYLVGLIDGEGTIDWLRDRPAVKVYNQNHDVMNWLLSKVGGSVSWNADKRGRQPTHCWQIASARDVYALCCVVGQHLLVKSTNASFVIQKLLLKYGEEKLNGDLDRN